MERKDFLNKISGGIALTCVTCMMAACSKDSTTTNTSSNNNNQGNNTSNLLTVNLASELLAINDFISSNGVIVVRIASENVVASFAAFSSACTHEGATVAFDKQTSIFTCPRHGAVFNINGTVKPGWPASSPLKSKTVSISGTTLTVK